MSAGWVAGSVRATALARRRLDRTGLRLVAGEDTLAAAVDRLAGTPYGHDVRRGDALPQAQRAVASTLLWHLRVLAGWVPPHGAQVIRALAAGFEVANVDEHLAGLAGRPAEPAYALGSLQTAWSRLARTRTPGQVRAVLASSPWGDPGSSSAREVHLSMTLAWAQRVVDLVPAAADWARSHAATATAGEALLGSPLPPDGPLAARIGRLLGAGFASAVTGPGSSLDAAVEALPRHVRQGWTGVLGPGDLWRAEAALLDRVGSDAVALLGHGDRGPRPVVGAVALLAVDAWRARAALEVAARAGADGRETTLAAAGGVLDALA